MTCEGRLARKNVGGSPGRCLRFFVYQSVLFFLTKCTCWKFLPKNTPCFAARIVGVLSPRVEVAVSLAAGGEETA